MGSNNGGGGSAGYYHIHIRTLPNCLIALYFVKRIQSTQIFNFNTHSTVVTNTKKYMDMTRCDMHTEGIEFCGFFIR